MFFIIFFFFFFSSRRRHTMCALVTGVQTCALPISIRARPASDPFPKHPTFRTKTSEGRWIEAHNNLLACGGFIGIRFDVTEQVAAEEALKESEQRFRDFAQSGPGGFWEMDESLRFSSFLEVQKGPGRSQPTAAEATGRTVWELFGANPAFDVFWRALRDDLQARRPVRDQIGRAHV